jgi:hypothetical protein
LGELLGSKPLPCRIGNHDIGGQSDKLFAHVLSFLLL